MQYPKEACKECAYLIGYLGTKYYKCFAGDCPAMKRIHKGKTIIISRAMSYIRRKYESNRVV